jgi:hypothetical protein
MKQLDLFGAVEENPPYSPFAKGGVVVESDTPLSQRGDGGDLNTTKPALTTDKLAHYRAKLAKWDANGYDQVAEVITSDTIHGHNQLGRDMKIVGTLRRLQWTPEAIATYFLTRRIKNNRTVENGRDRSKGDSK